MGIQLWWWFSEKVILKWKVTQGREEWLLGFVWKAPEAFSCLWSAMSEWPEMHSRIACRGRWTTRGSDLQPPCIHRPDFTRWVEKSRHTRGHYLSTNNTKLQWAQVGRETCQWVQSPGHRSCSGRAGREQGSGGPSAWRPAWGRVSVSLRGQANGLAEISRAGAGVCNKIHPGQSVGLCSAVVSGEGQLSGDLEAPGGCQDAPKGSLSTMVVVVVESLRRVWLLRPRGL